MVGVLRKARVWFRYRGDGEMGGLNGGRDTGLGQFYIWGNISSESLDHYDPTTVMKRDKNGVVWWWETPGPGNLVFGLGFGPSLG